MARKYRSKVPKDELERTFPSEMMISMEDGRLLVNDLRMNPASRALHGMARAMLNNMVIGVSSGFERVLEVNGVGYRAELVEKI